jgi:hypothetical protein
MVSSLYRPNAGVFESWPTFDSNITVIIDNMMNLELPFFAAQNGGDPNWHKWAVNHAVKTMDNHVRADGSTFHDLSLYKGSAVSHHRAKAGRLFHQPSSVRLRPLLGFFQELLQQPARFFRRRHCRRWTP